VTSSLDVEVISKIVQSVQNVQNCNDSYMEMIKLNIQRSVAADENSRLSHRSTCQQILCWTCSAKATIGGVGRVFARRHVPDAT
jgi:hypothetical protein